MLRLSQLQMKVTPTPRLSFSLLPNPTHTLMNVLCTSHIQFICTGHRAEKATMKVRQPYVLSTALQCMQRVCHALASYHTVNDITKQQKPRYTDMRYTDVSLERYDHAMA